MPPHRFHLAVPGDDLAAARRFYGETCSAARRAARPTRGSTGTSTATSSSRISLPGPGDRGGNPVDDHDVPVPHFGVLLDVDAFHALAERLRAAGTRS